MMMMVIKGRNRERKEQGQYILFPMTVGFLQFIQSLNTERKRKHRFSLFLFFSLAEISIGFFLGAVAPNP